MFVISEIAASVTLIAEPLGPHAEALAWNPEGVGFSRRPSFELRERVINLDDHQALAVKRWAEDARYVKEVHLFGSRARGCARDNSDVDLAITVAGSDARVALGNYLSFRRRWEDDLSKLLRMNVHVTLYNDPEDDMVRCSCEQHSVLLFP